MDTSNLISQAEFARQHHYSPQWISQLIAAGRLSGIIIGGVPYLDRHAKIKRKGKKNPALHNL